MTWGLTLRYPDGRVIWRVVDGETVRAVVASAPAGTVFRVFSGFFGRWFTLTADDLRHWKESRWC